MFGAGLFCSNDFISSIYCSICLQIYSKKGIAKKAGGRKKKSVILRKAPAAGKVTKAKSASKAKK